MTLILNLINRILFFIRLIWQLPQLLIGLLVFFILKVSKKIEYFSILEHSYISRIESNLNFKIFSLPPFIFAPAFTRLEKIQHEHWHNHQSIIFGPLYLLIYFSNLIFKKENNKFEKWADYLGRNHE